VRPARDEGAFEQRPPAPWQRAAGLESVLARWRSDPRVWPCFTAEEVRPPTQAQSVAFPSGLAPGVRAALEGRGIHGLYTHQARAFELASAGRDVVIATPTASGKSLCYHLPVLDRFTQEPDARALYLFPTKALSRDQELSLRGLMTEAGLPHGAVTYDGDTPGDARRAARERSGVLITNPDMLHAGILPHHASWARMFANLRIVVLDELHTYRGVFGSHLTNVLRRLDRIARFHGSTPTYVFASATIGNPSEHASRMLGRPVELVGESGAPTGERHVLVYNPPVVNVELGIRQSFIKQATRFTSELLRAGVSTILFGQSRNTVEVMLKYLRDAAEEDRIPPETIQAYRGGYLADTRRRIETGLRSGDVRCVVATHALELGVDIGALDAVVCAGYPGTVASTWQRFGRAGRRGAPSLALLVSSSAALDQYVAHHPEALLGAPAEQARIDPDNVEILIQHLKCAAFELPFEAGEGFRDVASADATEALRFLEQHRVLHGVDSPDGRTVFHWATDAYPAHHVSLRSVGWDNVVVIDVEKDAVLAEMDWRSSHTMLHEQAIYQHEGEQYQVERLDHPNHKAYVRHVAPDYFTTAMTHVRVEVLDEERHAPAGELGPLRSGLGEVSVVEKVVGYKKIKFHTHENVGYGDVVLPEMQMHTVSVWLTFPEALVMSLAAPRPAVVDAIRGLGVALHTVACVSLMTEPHDLGHALGSHGDSNRPPGTGMPGPGFDPTLFLFDQVPGGVGLSPRLFEQRRELLRRAARLIGACPCPTGCPACIGPESGSGASSRKALALVLVSAAGVI
jgi:DEAD/DEAH box helicase domain-containing protein